jgi:hypothetical protein
MAGQQDARFRGRIQAGDHVPMNVRLHLIGKISDVLPNDFLDWTLVPRGAGRLEQTLQKLMGARFHVDSFKFSRGLTARAGG